VNSDPKNPAFGNNFTTTEGRGSTTRKTQLTVTYMTSDEIDLINKIASDCYKNAKSKGFHDGDGDKDNVELMAAWTANLHGEISELWEAARKGQLNQPCDKPVPLTCAEEEFADIFIRCCDSSRAFGIDLGRAIHIKMGYNASRPHMHNKLA
jgi:NTP pyrophosphatase (non-canonical NTP hydrolase)